MEGVLGKIRSMAMRDTIALWQNAIRILSNREKQKQHYLARSVLAEIGKEWERRKFHPEDSADFFSWPSTEAPWGHGSLETSSWIKEGALHVLGYKVGNLDGEPQGVRERILNEVFSGPIPPVFPNDYLEEWGRPNSPARLQKMAETIAALTRNGKRRRDSRMQAAVRDWETDLKYLYQRYYVGKFRFAWPVSSI